MAKYLATMGGLLAFAITWLEADAYLKCGFGKENPDAIKEYLEKHAMMSIGAPIALPPPPDYRQPFDPATMIWWLDLISIGVILAILQTWCFFFVIERAMKSAKTVIQVEVKDNSTPMQRTTSKRNLRETLEACGIKQKECGLFD